MTSLFVVREGGVAGRKVAIITQCTHRSHPIVTVLPCHYMEMGTCIIIEAVAHKFPRPGDSASSFVFIASSHVSPRDPSGTSYRYQDTRISQEIAGPGTMADDVYERLSGRFLVALYFFLAVHRHVGLHSIDRRCLDHHKVESISRF